MILKSFGWPRSQTGPGGNAAALERMLGEARQTGPTPVLLVDDADQLSEAALPLLAFIAGGVAGPVKLKFILAGKPDLFEWLHERLPDIVGPTFELTEMSEADSADYIRHFLKAGGIDEARFDDEALADICRRARGVPLRINAVCQSCLDKATEEGLDRIDAVVVRKAIITLGIRGLAGDSGDASAGPDVGIAERRAKRQTQREIQSEADPNAGTGPGGGHDVRTGQRPKAGKVPGFDSDAAVAMYKTQGPSARPHAFQPDNGLAGQMDGRGKVAQKPPRRRWQGGLLLGGVVALGLAGLTLVLLPARGASVAAGIASAKSGAERLLRRATDGRDSVLVQPNPAHLQQVVEDQVARVRHAMSDFPESAVERFRRAVAMAEQDSELAVVGYARAALMGHKRAAYYLGQIYETGEGVPVDRSLAKAWYRQAGPSNRGAALLLAGLAKPETDGALQAPLPLFALNGKEAWIELIWTSAEGPDPSFYRVELATVEGDIAMRVEPVTISAHRMTRPDGAVSWRVVALNSDQSIATASPWLPIPGE